MDETLIEIVRRGANEAWGLDLSETQLAQFERYRALLAEWNETRMNLTSLSAPYDVAVKHFLDSLALLTAFNPPSGASLLDVGTGAGLPGLALKIARPDLRVTLLDSTAKKLLFCQAVADDLGLANVQTVHARAEDAAKRPELIVRFDVVTARAVAPLAKLLPWLAPFVGPSGTAVAFKGASVSEEMVDAVPVARRLGLRLSQPAPIPLPEAGEPTVRHLVLARRKES